MSIKTCLENEYKVVDKQTEHRIQLDHRVDSLILLVYVMLIVLSVITIWTFKHRRFRYFHETGLSVIYGLIVGIALRYGLKPSNISVEYYDLLLNSHINSTCGERLPPQKIIASMPVRDDAGQFGSNISFQYGFEQLASTNIPFNSKATFNPEIFFNVLLPPIIFSAGYSMKRSHFFQNIGAILTYAFLGTFMSVLIMGLICYSFTRIIPSLSAELSFPDCLFFGSIISATDPVTVLAIFNDLNIDVDLYTLVFGESVLNDALAIALSQSVEEYGSLSTADFDASAFTQAVTYFLFMFSVSFAIGVIVGAFTALLTKFTYIREFPLLETTLFVLMSYSTFLLAETIGFTGIVAVLFCGITQAHYTYNNLSEESKMWTKQFFELLSFLSENFVFAYIGVSTFTFQQHQWHVGFVFIALFACVVARVLTVYPLSALINLCRGHKPTCRRSFTHPNRQSAEVVVGDTAGDDAFPNGGIQINRMRSKTSVPNSSTYIPMNVQHMLCFSGLRGAMAFSLAIKNTGSEMRQMFFSTTIVVVMVTVLLCGSLTVSMLGWLKIRVSTGTEEVSPHHSNQGSSQDESQSIKRRGTWFNHYWSRFDKYYLMPLLTNRGPPLTNSVPWCCFRLAKLFTTAEQRDAHSTSFSSTTNLCRDSNDIASPPTVIYLQDPKMPYAEQSAPKLNVVDGYYDQSANSMQHSIQSKSFVNATADMLNQDLCEPQNAGSDSMPSSKTESVFIHQRLV